VQEKNFAERFASISLGHKLIAFVAAVGIAVGGHLLLQRRAVMNASAAELSFDAHAATAIDPGLASAHDPAVALAESVLTDAKVKQLAASAPTDASSITGRLGEFRSNLQLTQPSANMLEVRYFASGDALSYQAANMVARALAQSGFSRSGAPVDAAPAPAPPAPAPKAPQAAAGNPATQPNPSLSALSASLGEVETVLSSTRRNLDNPGGSHGGGTRGHHSGASSRREFDQQHLIKAGTVAAERKMNAIRTSPAARNLTGTASEQLAEIQHAIAAILSGGGASAFRSVGVSAAQIRRERAQLDDAIETVHRGRMALQNEASAPSQAEDNAAQGPAADGSAPASSSGSSLTTTDLTPSGQPVQGPRQSAPAQNADTRNSDQSASPNDSGDLLTNPFTLVRSATTAMPFPWWITLVAGLGLGLLYWTFAALPSQEVSYDLFDTPEPTHSGGNMITPSFSYAPREDHELSPRVAPGYVPAERNIAPEDDERRPRRAAFRFEQASPQTPAFAPAPDPPQPAALEEPAVAEDPSPAAATPAVEIAPEPPPAPSAVAAPESEPRPLPEAHFLTIDDLRSRFAAAGKAAPETAREQDSSGQSPFNRLAG